MPQSVLVPLDFGFDADRALPVGDSLARRIGARLDVVSLTSPGIDPTRDTEEARAHARMADVDVAEVHIRNDDDIAGGVLATAADHDAVVCCATHARGRLGEWLCQSVGADIVRRSTSPLMLVGPHVEIDPRPTFTEIVACVQHAPLRPRIASTAATWSRLLDAKVRLLTIVDDRAHLPVAWEPIKRLATTLTELGIETMPEVLVAEDAAEAILHTTGFLGSALLIAGAHDRTDVGHPALGSVSLDLVRRSPNPVLVVPSGTRPRPCPEP
jgi:nucleotide-binding universal stress UspA family protein